jgi:hypothetical protein
MSLPDVVQGYDFDDEDLDYLADVVRIEIEQVQVAWSNALGHAMNAGDALIAAQPKVTDVPWKKWLKENCFVAVSTAQLYMQLARHRDEIEAELQRGVELSLRGARKLISGPPKPEDEEDGEIPESGSESVGQEETLEAHWWRAPSAERSNYLDAVGVAAILKEASPAFIKDLAARLPKLRKPPTLKLAANHLDQMREARARGRYRPGVDRGDCGGARFLVNDNFGVAGQRMGRRRHNKDQQIGTKAGGRP